MSIETAARKFLEAWYREFYAGTEEGEPTLDTPKLDALDLAYIELKRALETPPSAWPVCELCRTAHAPGECPATKPHRAGTSEPTK